MLEIRLSCENCDRALPVNSQEAMICTFECTFCKTCVEEIFQNVCPNCTGGFVPRPIRPKNHLKKYPPRVDKVYKPINREEFEIELKANVNIPPHDR